MNFIKKLNKKISDFFYDHSTLRFILEYVAMVFGAILSSFVFSFGYKAFSNPILDGEEIGNIVTGGVGGVAQIIVKIFELCGFPVNKMAPFGSFYWNYIIQSAFYVLLNIPIFILAFRRVGKKFALFTLVNVSFYFLFVNILPSNLTNMFYESSHFSFKTDFLARAIFAGICTGLAIVISFRFGHSTGGSDVVSIYVNGKKNHISIGKITMSMNICIILVYTILSILNDNGDLSPTTMALYSFVYLFVESTVIDALTIRDKKNQLQIITSNQTLPELIINYFPHSCTIVQGKGAYSKQDKLVIYTVLSYFEVKKAVKIIQDIDPNAFITITKVDQVVGRFYIQPRQ